MYRRSAIFLSLLTAAATTVVHGSPVLLLIGDSMTAGQGIHKQFIDHPPEPIGNPAVIGGTTTTTTTYEFGGSPGEACWRENERAGAALVAEQLGFDFVNMACAGAGLDGILTQWDYVQTELGGSSFLEGATILLSLGANDGLQVAGLQGDGLVSVDTLALCFRNALPFSSVDTDELTDWDQIESRIDQVFQTITSEAPASARIRVVGYPLQFRPFFDFLCFSLLGPCGRTFDALLSRVNTILRAMTERYQLEFVEIEDNSLLPGGACSVTDRHIRDVEFDFRSVFSNGISFEAIRGIVTASTLHPTAEAHELVAGRILESLA